MPWIYHQRTGELVGPDGAHCCFGYAGGNCGFNPEGVNNPDKQAVRNVGPLPRGRYYIARPVEHTHLGPFALPLLPDPANEMFGRGGFFAHDDTPRAPGHASEGCPVLPFAWRNAMAASDDKVFDVVE